MLDFSVTFIITIINIIILTFILKKLLFKPVTKFMADRAKLVEDSINHAELDKASARELLERYEIQLKNAETEAREIIKTARENAKIQADSIAEAGKKEAENFITAARKQIETERMAVLAKFKVEAVALVIAASAKLAARDFSSEDNRRYAAMILDELQTSGLVSFKKGSV